MNLGILESDCTDHIVIDKDRIAWFYIITYYLNDKNRSPDGINNDFITTFFFQILPNVNHRSSWNKPTCFVLFLLI